jgi:hypothetical protein
MLRASRASRQDFAAPSGTLPGLLMDKDETLSGASASTCVLNASKGCINGQTAAALYSGADARRRGKDTDTVVSRARSCR